MQATKKMKAFGLALLQEKTGNDLSVLYRWISAIDSGAGIRDANKRKLMQATAGTPYAITWSDFDPDQVEERAA